MAPKIQLQCIIGHQTTSKKMTKGMVALHGATQAPQRMAPGGKKDPQITNRAPIY
jgi:hypothetical protein